jgi:hypothetical protein
MILATEKAIDPISGFVFIAALLLGALLKWLSEESEQEMNLRDIRIEGKALEQGKTWCELVELEIKPRKNTGN